jgi:hypothetical protein
MAWVVWPVSYSDAALTDLRLEAKDDYLRMTAASYNLDGNLQRAWSRIGALGLQSPRTAPGILAKRESKPIYQQALIHLSLDLEQPAAALARATYTPRPTHSPAAAPTIAPLSTRQAAAIPSATPAPPTSTPTGTPLPPATEPPIRWATSVTNPDAPKYGLRKKEPLGCSETNGRGLIEVQVVDAEGKPQPGIGVEVSWPEGVELFYTGLAPERGMGYADLPVSRGSYNLRLADNATSPVEESLVVESDSNPCLSESNPVYGWRIEFQAVAP